MHRAAGSRQEAGKSKVGVAHQRAADSNAARPKRLKALKRRFFTKSSM
jgi:hypothetical protein